MAKIEHIFTTTRDPIVQYNNQLREKTQKTYLNELIGEFKESRSREARRIPLMEILEGIDITKEFPDIEERRQFFNAYMLKLIHSAPFYPGKERAEIFLMAYGLLKGYESISLVGPRRTKYLSGFKNTLSENSTSKTVSDEENKIIKELCEKIVDLFSKGEKLHILDDLDLDYVLEEPQYYPSSPLADRGREEKKDEDKNICIERFPDDSQEASSIIQENRQAIKKTPVRQITRKTVIYLLIVLIVGSGILYFIFDAISRPTYGKNHPTSETMLNYVSRKIETDPSYCFMVAQGIIEMLEESGNIHTLDQNTDYRLMAEFVQKTQEKSASSTNGALIGMAQWYKAEDIKTGNTTQEYASYAEAMVNLLNDHLIRHEAIIDTVPERHWVVKTYSDPSMIFIEEDNTLPLDSRWVYYDFILEGEVSNPEVNTLFVIGFNQQDYRIGLFDTNKVNHLSVETPPPTYYEGDENTPPTIIPYRTPSATVKP